MNVAEPPSLADLVAKITPENCHGEIDFGKPIGNELPMAVLRENSKKLRDTAGEAAGATAKA